MRLLIRRQLNSKNPATRRKAAEALCQTPRLRSLPLLRLALANEDAEVRRLAAEAMGALEDDRCREPLMEALRDGQPPVIIAAIHGLRRMPDDRVRAVLVQLLRHPDSGVRAHSGQALDSLGWQAARKEDEIWHLVARGRFQQAASFGAEAFPVLEAVLGASPPSLTVKIIEVLVGISHPRLGLALARVLNSDDPAVCVAAASALGRVADAQTLPLLIRLLRHKNAQVRSTTVESLSRLRAEDAVEPISQLLSDPVWEVRREAAEALGRLEDCRAVEPLSASLKDQDADVREASAIALGNVGDPRGIRPLVLALKDPSSSVRRIAAAALSRIDHDWCSSTEARSAAQELKASLDGADPNVRHFVAQLLVGMGELESAAGPAPDAMPASSPDKRQKLAVSLFELMLCDSDRDLRQAAAEALGRLGDTRSRSALLRAQSDSDAGVRAAAQQALRAVQPQLEQPTASHGQSRPLKAH